MCRSFIRVCEGDIDNIYVYIGYLVKAVCYISTYIIEWVRAHEQTAEANMCQLLI